MFEIGTASDYRDLLAKLDTFLTATGSAFGLTYAGTGNGTLTGYKGGSASVAETFTITCTDSQQGEWSVVGSVSGALALASAGTAYTGTKIQFLITAGATAFADGDVFTLSTAPKWTSLRREPGAVITCGGAGGGTIGQYSFENVIDGKWDTDTSRYWQNSILPTAGTPKWLQFDFPAARTIREYQIQAHSSTGYAPKTWTFDYWNGSAWVTLDTQTNASFISAEVKTFAITSPQSATRYRLNFTDAQGSTWIINRIAMREEVGEIDVASSQYAWQAPNNDGSGGQYCGVHAFCRGDVPYYDWELMTCDAWNGAAPFFNQQGIQRNIHFPLASSSFPYWLVCDGRRVVVVAKVAANYEAMYLGFIEPFFTPQHWPYPAFMGGSLGVSSASPATWESVYYGASQTGVRRNIFTHSDSWTGETSGHGTGRVRKLDGSWLECFSRYNGAKGAPAAGWVWPWCLGASAMDANLDGSYTLFPAMLLDGTPNPLGQLSGISFLTGQGLTPEDTITIGAVKHLAVPNVYRTTREDFLAVRLD